MSVNWKEDITKLYILAQLFTPFYEIHCGLKYLKVTIYQMHSSCYDIADSKTFYYFN